MNKLDKKIVSVSCFLAAITIGIGAFGAHGLERLVSQEAIDTFETGVRYQMYHAFLLLILGSTSICNTKVKKNIYWTILIGVILFSGSIYGLSTNELTSFDFKTIALVTPIGGTILIVCWILMLINFLKMKLDN